MSPYLAVVAEPSHFLPARLGHTSWLGTTFIASLELRSAHRRAIAKVEMGRWYTGSFAFLKPELAFLTRKSCLQQLVWDLTSDWKSLDQRFLIQPPYVPFPDWVLKSRHGTAASLPQSGTLPVPQAASVGACHGSSGVLGIRAGAQGQCCQCCQTWWGLPRNTGDWAGDANLG